MALATASGGRLPTYRAATDEDLEGVVAAFAAAAGRVASAGIDAVEIHAAHGYLLSTFLSPGYNQRTDAWGGSVAGRARPTCEVIAAVREVVGPHYPVLVRINRTNIFANWWVVQLCLVAVGILLSMFCEVMRARDFAMLGVLTPVTTLFGSETVSYQSRKGIMIAGSFFSVMWLIAALIRARMHFADYTRLEHEALTLADHSPHRANDIAQ
jgi:2,4-dienoyl-CoA reductase-like NADH-dependent reductase (Old Yellow Enzyme family)